MAAKPKNPKWRVQLVERRDPSCVLLEGYLIPEGVTVSQIDQAMARGEVTFREKPAEKKPEPKPGSGEGEGDGSGDGGSGPDPNAPTE